MKIAIDLQPTQSRDSRHRGIGRYAQSIVDALLAIPSGDEFFLYASAAMPPPIVAAPWSEKVHLLPFLPDGQDARNETLLKSVLLAEKADVVFLPSPMELQDVVIPDFEGFPASLYVVCHDLIPLLFADRYLATPESRAFYMHRLRNIKNADCVVANSEATRQDTLRMLQKSDKSVVTIGGGAAPNFAPVPNAEREEWRRRFVSRFHLNKPYLLCTGGGDRRKNLHGLISAFGLLPAALKAQYQLVIACRLSEPDAAELHDLARVSGLKKDQLILTGFVTDEELNALYSLCDLFVFPSLYEGFGLPLVEAMACGAPAISADNSSLKEIVTAPEQQFDGSSPAAIAECIGRTLSDTILLSRLSADAPGIAAQFTWEKVAGILLGELDKAAPRPAESVFLRRAAPRRDDRETIAFFSPFRPLNSGISDYSEDLLRPLGVPFEIDLWVDDGYQPRLESGHRHQIRNIRTFESGVTLPDRQYYALLYQMGNSGFHHYMYDLLRRHAGIVVVHDYNMNGMIINAEATRPDLGITLSAELEHAYGPRRAAEILAGVQSRRGSVGELPNQGIFTNRRLFTRSLGVIVHSQWAYDQAINEHGQDCDFITRIPQPMPLIPLLTDAEIIKARRRERDLPENGIVFIACGAVTWTKRPLQLLDAFQIHHAQRPDDFLIFAGADEMDGDFQTEIDKRGLTESVRLTGFVADQEEFYRWIELADIGVALRFPSNGETSAALLRLLLHGKPCIVTDLGSFGDYPASLLHKIPAPDQGDEKGALIKALRELATNDDYRRRLGAAARTYIEQEHAPERSARLYGDFIHTVMSAPQTRARLLSDYIGRGVSRIPPEHMATSWEMFAHPLRVAADAAVIQTTNPLYTAKTGILR